MKRNKPSRQYRSTSRIDRSEADDEVFKIETFLEDNYKIFTLLSIFGALIVYLFDLLENSPSEALRIGISSSLVLFLLSSWSVIKRVNKATNGLNGFIEGLANRSQGSYELLLFVVSFGGLIWGFFGLGTQLQSSLGVILQVAAFLVGFSAVGFLIDKVADHLPKTDLSQVSIQDQGLYKYLRTQIQFLVSLFFMFIISGNILDNYSIPLLTLSIDRPVIGIFVSFIWGFFLTSMLLLAGTVLETLGDIMEYLSEELG